MILIIRIYKIISVIFHFYCFIFELALDISTCIQDLLCVYHSHLTYHCNNTERHPSEERKRKHSLKIFWL